MADVEAARVAEAERKARVAQAAKDAEAERAAAQVKPPDPPKAPGVTFEATAYTAFCDTGCIGITATGIDVSQTIYAPSGLRIVAVDPAVIPLGTVVEITLGNGAVITAEAQDTGGAIVGNRIDLLVATTDEAWTFGRQAVELRIK